MRKAAALLALVLAAVALVACGDDDGTTTEPSGEAGAESGEEAGDGGGSSTLKFETPSDGKLAYTTSEAATSAGAVLIEFDNEQSILHDVAIEDSSGKTLGQTETITGGGGTAKAIIDLKPGSYTFYCSVPGHREAGMEGTLKVK